jgi:hypothetical protein
MICRQAEWPWRSAGGDDALDPGDRKIRVSAFRPWFWIPACTGMTVVFPAFTQTPSSRRKPGPRLFDKFDAQAGADFVGWMLGQQVADDRRFPLFQRAGFGNGDVARFRRSVFLLAQGFPDVPGVDLLVMAVGHDSVTPRRWARRRFLRLRGQAIWT